MLIVWRITTARFAQSAFSGEGARLYEGRWTPKGLPVVYTAANQSLAMLEMLVQDQPLRARYVMIEARIPSAVTIDGLFGPSSFSFMAMERFRNDTASP